jgi:hypothetical protein
VYSNICCPGIRISYFYCYLECRRQQLFQKVKCSMYQTVWNIRELGILFGHPASPGEVKLFVWIFRTTNLFRLSKNEIHESLMRCEKWNLSNDIGDKNSMKGNSVSEDRCRTQSSRRSKGSENAIGDQLFTYPPTIKMTSI